MIDDDNIDDIKKNYKKILTNSISYTINKKMNVYDMKLDTIIKKLECNFDNIINNIEVLKLNNSNLEQKIENLEERNSCLEEKIDNLENIILNFNKKEIVQEIPQVIVKEIIKEVTCENKYKDLKEEFFDLDYDFVKSCLDNTNIQNDIKIFKKMYIDNVSKEYYPIRHMKKKFQYWRDEHMNDDDSNGNYIKNTVLKNIENCYLKINIFENYTNDMDKFLKNQDHINKLNEEKYKDKFLSKIISIINI